MLARWAWERRAWILAGLVIVLAVALAQVWHGRAAAEAARDRLAEEAKATAAQIPVVHDAGQVSLDAEAEQAKREAPELRAEVDRATKEIGRLKVLLVVRGQTKPVVVQAPARPNEPTPCPGGVAGPACVLRAGDLLRLELDGIGAGGPAGARLLLAAVSARREADGALLGRDVLSAPLTHALETPPTTALGREWRAGVVGGASGQGWLVGGAYSQRLDLWGWRPEVVVTAAGGPGKGVVLGGVLF